MELLKSSKLYAIQKIPGERQTDKFKEIGRIVKRIIGAVEKESDLTAAIEVEKVPKALVPLIKVLVGVKRKSHELITEALKSNDSEVIVEALRAKWYFDGSDKVITTFKYFSTNIFPFVSMQTAREIVKKLAIGLTNKKELDLAADFFNGITSFYGVQEAVRLLPSCRSEFVYEAIVKHRIVLSNNLLKTLYFKHQDVALKYLKFTSPYEIKGDAERTLSKLIQAHDYQRFMPILIKKHPEVFVDLQEIHHTSVTISGKRSKMLLKNGKEILIQRPRDLIDLLPLKLVYNSLTTEEFETMFGNIFEKRWDLFNLSEMINHLDYYPVNKKSALIRKKVEEKYGFDIYEKVDKLTSDFLLLVPREDRFILAKRIIMSRHEVDLPDEENSWYCFLPIEEAIPALKMQIDKNLKTTVIREKLFAQLIYVCKLNDDLNALLDVLRYVDENHKNEKASVLFKMIDRIEQEFKIHNFDFEYWQLLFNIIKRIKMKRTDKNAREFWVLIKILKQYVCYCEQNNLESNEAIGLIVKLFREGRVSTSWQLLQDEPKLERKYLDANFRNDYPLNETFIKSAIIGIYGFNERLKPEDLDQKMSIQDYPDLLAKIKKILKKEANEKMNDENEDATEKDNESNWYAYTKEIFRKHEPELFSSLFPKECLDPDSEHSGTKKKKIENTSELEENENKQIFITQAVIALRPIKDESKKIKIDYNEVKANWIKYYKLCQSDITTYKKHRVKTFLKELRWFHDMPIKFAELSLKDLNLKILACLVDGKTFSKIAATFLPEEKGDWVTGHVFTPEITNTVRNTTTPISIDLVKQCMSAPTMYSLDIHMNYIAKISGYVAYRTPADKLTALVKILSNEKLKRHSISLMGMFAIRNDLVEFYAELWKAENNTRIQSLLAKQIGKLFSKSPSEESWQLIRNCMTDLTFTEGEILQELIGSMPVPHEFADVFGKLVLKKVNDFTDQGMQKYKAAKYLLRLFENIKPECKDHLSDDFYRNSMQCYLESFYEVNNADRFIVKVYLNPSSVHFEQRLKYMSELLKKESKRWHDISIVNRNDALNFVDSFVQAVVNEVQKFKGNLRLVESLYNIFSENFSPYQHPWSHIMLFLSTEFLRVDQSFKAFGTVLSVKIDTLVDTYKPEYFMQIADLIKEFICNFNFFNYNEYYAIIQNRLDLLEGLIEEKKTYGLIIAAKLLHQKIVSEFDRQHCNILKQLSKVDHPIVRSLL